MLNSFPTCIFNEYHPDQFPILFSSNDKVFNVKEKEKTLMNIKQGTNYDVKVFKSQLKNYIFYKTAKQGEKKDLKQDKM